MKKGLSVLSIFILASSATLVLTGNIDSNDKMSQISFFFLEFIVFLIIIICIPWFFSVIMTGIINNINNCFEVFNKKNIKDIVFFISEYKYKYLGQFFFYFFLNCSTFIICLLIWFIFGSEGTGIYLSIPFVIAFLFTCIWLFFLMRKYWIKIKKIGFQSKETAITNFKKFQENCKIGKINFFTLFENNIIALRNFPFQFQQKKYQKKNIKLTRKFNKKKISQEKYQIKLLIFFTTYLKVYARFFIWMKNENEKKNKKASITIEDQKYDDVTLLPQILINNFFAFINQTEKEFKNNQNVD